MTVKELREILNRYHGYHSGRSDDEPVSVILALPSIGPRANTKVKSASFGFDWDRGLQFGTEARLVPKNEKQDVFEAAFELLAWIATKPVKKETYEIRTARKILERYGCDEEKFALYRRVFHKESI